MPGKKVCSKALIDVLFIEHEKNEGKKHFFQKNVSKTTLSDVTKNRMTT